LAVADPDRRDRAGSDSPTRRGLQVSLSTTRWSDLCTFVRVSEIRGMSSTASATHGTTMRTRDYIDGL
jgi:hypothetical protein